MKKYKTTTNRIEAFRGTRFNPDNLQHAKGTDLVRYAICIQQARDRKDFDTADKFRSLALTNPTVKVSNFSDRTEIHAPLEKRHGIVYDAL